MGGGIVNEPKHKSGGSALYAMALLGSALQVRETGAPRTVTALPDDRYL